MDMSRRDTPSLLTNNCEKRPALLRSLRVVRSETSEESVAAVARAISRWYGYSIMWNVWLTPSLASGLARSLVWLFRAAKRMAFHLPSSASGSGVSYGFIARR